MLSTENKHPFHGLNEMGVVLLISGSKPEVENVLVKKAGKSRDKKPSFQQRPIFSTITAVFQLIFELCFEEFAVQAGNVADGNMLGAFHLTGAGVGAGTKAQLVHFGHHGFRTTGAFDLTLRQ